MILGTAAYMSPEQAKGQNVDRRADIWAFGVVLHEMLTGARLFASDTVAETLAGVLKSDIDLEAVPAEVPPGLRRLLDRCLERNPRQRLRDIGEARISLEALRAGGDPGMTGAPQTVRQRSGLAPWVAAASIAGAAILGFAAHSALVPRPRPRVVRASVLPPKDTQFFMSAARPGPVALSPDGRFLAFTAARKEGAQTLWVRGIDEDEPRELAGSEGARYQFWSPDSEFVGFFVDDSLKKVPVVGGPAVRVCDARNGKGGSWSTRGVIVFAADADTPLSVVPDAGGVARGLTTLGPGESSHRHPRFLPDGEHFLFVTRRGSGEPLLNVGSLDGGPATPIIDPTRNAEYANGRLLFVRDQTLMAQPFDPDRLALTGDAVPLAENILTFHIAALAIFSVSHQGTLAYQVGTGGLRHRLTWRDTEAQELGALGDIGPWIDPNISPDGRLVALTRGGASSDVWIYDVERGLPRRFTFDASVDSKPIWSPDGGTLAFASSRGGKQALWSAPLAGSEEPRMIAEVRGDLKPLSWSPTGAEIVVFERGGEPDLAAVAGEGGEPRPLLATRTTGATANADVSPDGRWLAFAALDTGRSEVYVTTFPAPGRRWQITMQGGREPRWRGDGRRLFYRDERGLYAVEVDGRGATFSVRDTQRLFDLPTRFGETRQWDVTSDGQRFLIVEPAAGSDVSPITLVLNWDAELQEQ